MSNENKFSLEHFRKTIKDVQRSQYYAVDITKDGRSIVGDDEYLTCLSRDIRFEKTDFDFELMYFKTLIPAEKRFWKLAKTIQDDNSLEFILNYLSPQGNATGGFKFTGIDLAEIDITEAGVNQEGGEILSMTLVFAYRGKEIVVCDEEE